MISPFDIPSLRSAGFSGFLSIAEFRSQKLACVPGQPGDMGVYMILRESSDDPEFVATGTGGHFKGKDPNVSLEVLKSNWVTGATVINIGKAGAPGKAATLRSRLRQYLSFGAGRPVGHWGGRLIWQLADAEKLRVCWKPTPDAVPREVEQQLIQLFVKKYGRRPFANLAD